MWIFGAKLYELLLATLAIARIYADCVFLSHLAGHDLYLAYGTCYVCYLKFRSNSPTRPLIKNSIWNLLSSLEKIGLLQAHTFMTYHSAHTFESSQFGQFACEELIVFHNTRHYLFWLNYFLLEVIPTSLWSTCLNSIRMTLRTSLPTMSAMFLIQIWCEKQQLVNSVWAKSGTGSEEHRFHVVLFNTVLVFLKEMRFKLTQFGVNRVLFGLSFLSKRWTSVQLHTEAGERNMWATHLFPSAVWATSPAESSGLQIPNLNMSEILNQRYVGFNHTGYKI